jgi:uncharacterized protein (UPF0332 family)
MMPEQTELLAQARHSLSAAQLLQAEGYAGFAASRACYAMFYIAEAFLLGKGLAFSNHSGVHAAFGTHFAKTGIVPPEFHRYLIRSMGVRHAGDYGNMQAVTAEEAAEQITRAEQFLALASRLIGPIPPEDKQPG